MWQGSLDLWQDGLDLCQGGLDQQQGSLDLWQVGKIKKVALSAVLKLTATRDLEPRGVLSLRRTFPKKKLKWPDP